MPTIQQWIVMISAILIVSAIINHKYLIAQIMALKFGFKKPFAYTMVVDALYYVCMFFVTTVFFIIVQKQAEKLSAVDLESIKANIVNAEVSDAAQQEMAVAISLMKSFFFSAIIYLVIFLIIGLIIFTLFKGVIWAKIAKKKLDRKFFLKYFLLNLILLLILSVLVGGFGFFTGDYAFVVIPYVIVVFAYFAYYATFLFLRHEKMKNVFKCINYRMILPITSITIFYLLIFSIVFYIAMLNIALLTGLVYWFLLLCLFAFIRIYLYYCFRTLL